MPRPLTRAIIAFVATAVILLTWNNLSLRSTLARCRSDLNQSTQPTTEPADTVGQATSPDESPQPTEVPLTYAYDNLTSSEEDSLRALGLVNPIAAIDSALRQRTDLIPYEGTMGGTMNFYSPDAIRILGPDRIAAVFDDGHMQGHLLIHYRVNPGGRIEFNVLEATM